MKGGRGRIGRLGAATVVVACLGCTSGSPAAVTTSRPAGASSPGGDFAGGTPLTPGQAGEFAAMLFNNYEAGGATFTATVPYGSAATFVLNGDVDWRTHQIRAVLETRFTSGQPAQRRDLVVAGGRLLDGGVLGLTAAMAERGQPAVRWVARPLSADSRVPLDVVLNLILRLASDQRENPLLLRQGDTAFLRQEQLGSAAVSVYRFGPRTVYWLERGSGRLVKVALRLEVAKGATEVVLSDHRAVSIALPKAVEVVVSEAIPDVLARLESPAATNGATDPSTAAPWVSRPG